MNWDESPFCPQAGPPKKPPQQAKPIGPPARGPETSAADQPGGKKNDRKGKPAGPKSGGKPRDAGPKEKGKSARPA